MKERSQAYRAYTNIALIKYWGKRNQELFLPRTSSLSLTLNEFYTETQIQTLDTRAVSDQFVLNGKTMDAEATRGVSRFLDLFRNIKGLKAPLLVESYNHVPTAAGLASSASAYAALACAANDFFDTGMDHRALSIMARQGSGSASRSLFGGFVLWDKGLGDDSQSSYAQMIEPAHWDIGMVVVMVNRQAKKISSRLGMQHTIETSPFYQIWPQTVAEDLAAILPAIQAQDFEKVAAIAEHNAMKMHATLIGANPSLTYWQPESLVAMNAVRDLREAGLPCYFTMDAGPNVKVICRLSQAQEIVNYLERFFDKDQLVITGPGPAPHVVDQVTHHD